MYPIAVFDNYLILLVSLIPFGMSLLQKYRPMNNIKRRKKREIDSREKEQMVKNNRFTISIEIEYV
jgi:hypothetical protein